MEDLNYQEKVLLGINGDSIDLPDLDFDENNPEAVEAIYGQIHRVSKAVKRHGKKIHIDRRIIKQEIGASRARMQVLDRVQMLPRGLQNDLIKGRAQISDKILYSAIRTTDITANNLIPSDKGKKVGERNFSNGKYGYFMLIQGIQLLYDATDINGSYDDDLPDEVRNGELTIKVNSKELFSEIPLNVLASTNGYSLNELFNYYKVKNPKWILANKDVEAKINFAEDFTDGYLKILLFGQEIRPY